MFEVVKKLFRLLEPRERRRCYAIVLLAVVSGLLEMVSVAAILPFLAVLSDPSRIETNSVLQRIYTGLDFGSIHSFLIFLGIGVLGLVLLSLCVRLLSTYSIARFATMRAYRLSSKLMENYLRQPYTWFLDRNSARLGKTVLVEVQRVVNEAIMPVMLVISQFAVVLSLLGLLLVIEPTIALLAVLLFGGSYVLVFIAVRNMLARIGEVILQANSDRFKSVSEAMASVKDVKVLGVERAFIRRFRIPTYRMALVQSRGVVIREMPRSILEALALGSMLVLILHLLFNRSGTLIDILPTLGVFAFAGFRLFPALQAIYRQLGTLKMTKPAIDELYHDMMETKGQASDWPKSPDGPGLPLRECLEIDHVSYTYPSANRTALRSLELSIPARSKVGIVGGTGAGKTTLVDLMLGLLRPDEGVIRVDGMAVTRDNVRTWQRNIGYVPQQISLMNDSVAANIAFGIPPEEIAMDAVERASRTANLHAFVEGELPEGYQTTIGDHGVRLSGGQRQRIGIARALYHDPDVLILDEATSALDNLTEKAVMDAVHNLGQAKTIIMIAHRLSTVRNCDIIIMMEQGQIVARGSYEDLLGSSAKFRAMASAAAV
jgi:ATP-binding cassette, subfamily B, bacterial PglK